MDHDKNIYSAEMLRELEKHVSVIRNAIKIDDRRKERIIFNLYWIYDNKMYKAMGCDSITDYALQQFDFKKTVTYDYISIADRFGEWKEGSFTGSFAKKYKGYSPSKLALMVNMTDSEIEISGITPEMSVRDIKKAVKDNSMLSKLMDISSELKSSADLAKKEAIENKSDPESVNQTDPDTDEDGLIGYSLETIMSFDKKEAVFPDFSLEIEKIIKEAFEQHDHPDTVIEINVRFPVFKRADKSEHI